MFQVKTASASPLLRQDDCDSQTNLDQPLEKPRPLQKSINRKKFKSHAEWLTHAGFQLFLQLKWEKMQLWFYASALVQCLMYLFQMCFAIHVFLYQCLSSHNSNCNNQKNTWENEIADSSNPWILVASAILIIYNTLFLAKEMLEISILANVKEAELTFFDWIRGLIRYLGMLENPLELVSIICGIHVATVPFTGFHYYHYASAVLGLLFVWPILMVLQWSSISDKIAYYVQMSITLIKTMFKVMWTCVPLIINFSFAVCVLFPGGLQGEPFKKLFLPVTNMIKSGEWKLDGSLMWYDCQMILVFLALPVTIIIFVLLLVSINRDVKAFREKAQAILLSTKRNRIVVMENSIIFLYDYILKRGQKGSDKYPDIFVMDGNLDTTTRVILEQVFREMREEQDSRHR